MDIEQLGLQKAELQNLSVELEQAEQALAEGKGVSHFHIGEILEIKNSRFRVKKLGNKFMTLRVLPKKQEAD